MKKFIRVFISGLVLCSLAPTAQPIGETSAQVRAAAGTLGMSALGAGAGYFTGFIVSEIIKEFSYGNKTNKELLLAVKIISTLIGAVAAGGFSWSALDEHFYSLTPTGRIELAEKISGEMARDNFVTCDFNVTNMTNLGSVRNKLIDFLRVLESTRKNLIETKKEIARDPASYKGFAKTCDVLLEKITGLKNIIEPRVTLTDIEIADRVVREIAQDDLLTRDFATELDIVTCVGLRFTSNWSLVDARRELLSFAERLETSQKKLRKVLEKATKHPVKFNGQAQLCDESLNQILSLVSIIEQRIAALIMCKDFNAQLMSYDAHLKRLHDAEVSRLRAAAASAQAEASRERSRRQSAEIDAAVAWSRPTYVSTPYIYSTPGYVYTY
ncbi:MAG: hypothetical protein ABH827_04555 [bacterium]